MNRKTIICILLCTLCLGEIHAQKKSIGSSFSYAGVGLVYEHGIDAGSFAEIQLRMETSSVFARHDRLPGVSASFTWNMVFAETESRDGNKVVFFAGPGVMAGIAEDIGRGAGLMFGLKGRIGGECTFRRNVSVSLGVSPVIGVHLSRNGGMVNMLLYRTGLLYGIMPEVGIKYAF